MVKDILSVNDCKMPDYTGFHRQINTRLKECALLYLISVNAWEKGAVLDFSKAWARSFTDTSPFFDLSTFIVEAMHPTMR